jgi:Mitochondrial carrier protein
MCLTGGGQVLGDMGVGALAQLAAGVIFTPVDVIKERLQVPHPSKVMTCCNISTAQ